MLTFSVYYAQMNVYNVFACSASAISYINYIGQTYIQATSVHTSHMYITYKGLLQTSEDNMHTQYPHPCLLCMSTLLKLP